MIAHAEPVSHAMVIVSAIALVAWSVRRPDGTWVRHLAVALGAIAAVAALSPTMETVAERSYTGHMVQHLLLVLVAAPAVVVGVGGRAVRARVRIPVGTRRTARRALHLGLAFAFPLALVATHLTGWYAAAIDHRVVHDAEHVAYLLGAGGLWWSVAGHGTGAPLVRVTAAAVSMVSAALVGIVLTSADVPLVDSYARRLGTLGALADQRRAGALMWTAGMAMVVPVVVIAFWRWAAREQQARERLEQLTDHPRQIVRRQEAATATNA